MAVLKISLPVVFLDELLKFIARRFIDGKCACVQAFPSTHRSLSTVDFLPSLAVFDLLETDTDSNILHGVISLFFSWTLYAIFLVYSPLSHSWHGYTHEPLENLTTYTSSKHGNTQL